MIPFHSPSIGTLEQSYAQQSLISGTCFSERAQTLFREKTGVEGLLLVTSCTHALELAALVSGVSAGDEVILPSFAFTSTANAFLLRGARLVFCEVDPLTMNLDTRHMQELLTKRTRAVVALHYAGVMCDMSAINSLSRELGFFTVEDAAQAVGSTFNGLPAGTLSDAGCYSFHSTKNYMCGEGGGIVFSNTKMRERAAIIREKGTDREHFLRGEVEKYTWRDIGSSYVPADILAAVLTAQLERFDEIMQKRMSLWNRYHAAFIEAERMERLMRPFVPSYAAHNAHIYYILLPTRERRDYLQSKLLARGINAATHYEPLHSSRMGLELGYKPQDLPVTVSCASRLLRLPLFTDMPPETADIVIDAVLTELRARR